MGNLLGWIIGTILRKLIEALRGDTRTTADRARAAAGEQGERATNEALRAAADEGCYIFRSLREPSAGDIDHLVVGPGGITLVETKANRGTLTWSGDPDAPMLMDGAPMPRDPLAQMQRQMDAFERRFSRSPISEGPRARPLTEILGTGGTHWLWCFSRARVPGGRRTSRPHLATPASIATRIMEQPVLFESEQVDYIAGRIKRAYGREPEFRPSGRSPENNQPRRRTKTSGPARR